jgi:hypothetical protein
MAAIRKAHSETEEEEPKPQKKTKVIRRKLPRVQRVRDGTRHDRKEVRSIPEANKLRKAVPGMLREQLKKFEDLAVRLYETYAHSPDLVFLLPEFFAQRWRDEHKNGWVHTAERTLLGSPQVSFRDALLLFLRDRKPEYFDESIMVHRNLEISRELVRLLQAANEKSQEAKFSMRQNVVAMAHAAVEALQGVSPDDLQIPLEPTYEVEREVDEFSSSPVPVPSHPPPVKAEPIAEEEDESELSEVELDKNDSLDPDDTHTRLSVQTLSPFELVRYAYEYQRDRRVIERIVRYADRSTVSRARLFRPLFGMLQEYQSAAESPSTPLAANRQVPVWQLVFDLRQSNWAAWQEEIDGLDLHVEERVRRFCDQVRHASWMQYFLVDESTQKMLREQAGSEAVAFWQEFMT